jgi:hypothetical protein
MMRGDDIHSTAEKFLKEYLSKTGSKPEAVQPSSAVFAPARRPAETQAAAKDLIREHLKKRRQDRTEAERHEIEEPQRVVLSRRSQRCESYLYGFKRGVPIFTHDKALALVVDPVDSDKLSRLLREKHSLETFVLPAPELRRGSL